MGAVPASYPWIRAAKYLGVAPWELIARDDGIWWCNQAIAIENAEHLAQRDMAKRHGTGGR